MDAKKNEIKFLVLIIGIALIYFLGRYFHIDTQYLQGFLKRYPVVYSGIVFVTLYVIVTFFIWLSKDIFRLVAALIFGAYLSTLLVFIAEIINAIILFNLSRYLGRAYVENALKKIDERLGRLNFLWLFLFRCVPIIPFRFLDLSIGLTKISFAGYLAAVILGSPLRIFWVQYALAGLGLAVFNNPYAVAVYLLRNNFLFVLGLVYLALIIIVAFKIKRKD